MTFFPGAGPGGWIWSLSSGGGYQGGGFLDTKIDQF